MGLLSNYTPPPHNQAELAKVIRGMQDESLNKHKEANHFNQLGAAIVQHGIDDKRKATGWPVESLLNPPAAGEKKML